MNSRLYRGVVWHSRGEPAYTFQYGVWYLCLDLAERDEVAARLRLLSHNRHNVTSFWDRDFLVLTEAVGVQDATQTYSRGAPPQDAHEGLRNELVTLPRILGHAFNPVSFFLERQDGVVTGVRAEVHNTWGERHVYALENRAEAGAYESEAAKAFYVSPFLPMQGKYGFELREDEDGRLRIKIDLHDDEGEQLFAGGIDIRPLALTESNLLRLLITYPLANLKTVAGIHWQGFKLWLRGVEFRANPRRVVERKKKELWPRGH